jgi:tRNA-2-methylthio-N6-dimethylallyladenosine synthase
MTDTRRNLSCEAGKPSVDHVIDTPLEQGHAPKAGVWIKTFGCQMNEYDSEKMLSLLKNTHRAVEDPAEAEVLLVNTCSVREKAAHKMYSLLGSLREIKEQNPGKVLGVAGCVAQQEGQNIVRRSPYVDFVFGTHNLSLLPSLVERAKGGFPSQVAVDYRDEWEELPDDLNAFPKGDGKEESLLASSYFSSTRALVAIQRGCDKRCSFCVVPNTRGPQVSRSLDEILKEVKLKVRLGAREVLLLGQTVNSYGLDLSPRVKFEQLIRRLAEIEGLDRIRFTSPHPAEVRPGFIKLYGEIPQLCSHIHLPLQSGNDRILKAMNRNYRRERYLQIVKELREQCPNISLTSDIIVGFPTETEAEFEDTLDVMREVRYNASYSFKYSPRPHTVSQEIYSEAQEVDAEVAQDRLRRLQSLQEEHSLAANKSLLGQTLEVLVEGKHKHIPSAMRGRIAQNTIVEVLGEGIEIGSMVSARIDHASPHGLRGTVVER